MKFDRESDINGRSEIVFHGQPVSQTTTDLFNFTRVNANITLKLVFSDQMKNMLGLGIEPNNFDALLV